ncbi:MAG: SPOR domain-containing protein, partial [Sphingopyxis sp.]
RPRGELIAAPEGDYKNAPPAEPGRFDGEGNAAVAASEGVATQGRVDPTQLPEQPAAPVAAAPKNAASVPVKGAVAAAPRAVTQSGPVPAAGAATAATAGAAGAATAGAAGAATGGGMIQLGAFASEATAVRAWDSMKARFSWLGPVNRSIVSADVNGRTVYRLRAAAGSSSAARDLCSRLRVAGENCIVLP